jgi:hypothetical protein
MTHVGDTIITQLNIVSNRPFWLQSAAMETATVELSPQSIVDFRFPIYVLFVYYSDAAKLQAALH